MKFLLDENVDPRVVDHLSALGHSDGGHQPMSITHWSRPPRRLRQAKLDNLVLVPGSQWPYKAKWQQLANSLPDGSTLIVLPSRDCPQRRTLQIVATCLRTKGFPVTCQNCTTVLMEVSPAPQLGAHH